MKRSLRFAVTRRVLGAILGLVTVGGLASAQPVGDAPVGPTWYAGTLSAEGDTQFAHLHLTLFEDGFAFGRIQLPELGQVLLGPGHLRDGTELRLMLSELQVGEDPWWAAQLAHLAATDPDAVVEPPLRETVAVLTATRDVDFADEGTELTGTFRWSSGEPLELGLQRVAHSARWEFTQGRISSAVVLPFLTQRPELNQWLERDAMPAWRSFISDGRSLEAEHYIGWGWYREERVEVAGAAGDLLSVLSTVDTYTGGAHPNTFHHSYLLKAGPTGVTRVGLADLFGRRTGWLRGLSEMVIQGLRDQRATWVVEGQVVSLGADDLAVFTLSAQGITFHFSPYLMGPYVQGTFLVTLPYADVVALAAPDSPLRTFAAGEPFVMGTAVEQPR